MVKRNVNKFRFTKNENTTPNEEDCLILTNSDLIERIPIDEVQLRHSFAETGFFLDTVIQHDKVIYTDGIRKKVLKDRYNNTQGLTYVTLTPNDLCETNIKPFETINLFDFKMNRIIDAISVEKVFYKEGDKEKEI